MKNVMKAFGIALIVSGVFAVTNVSAQTAPASQSTTKTSTQTTPDKGTPSTTTTTKTATTSKSTVKTTDKVIGKDAQGNTVYQCSKGNYYLNTKGVKTNEPKGAKVTPMPKN